MKRWISAASLGWAGVMAIGMRGSLEMVEMSVLNILWQALE
ncbi:hypothetical protein [Chromobacterium piscinae]